MNFKLIFGNGNIEAAKKVKNLKNSCGISTSIKESKKSFCSMVTRLHTLTALGVPPPGRIPLRAPLNAAGATAAVAANATVFEVGVTSGESCGRMEQFPEESAIYPLMHEQVPEESFTLLLQEVH